MAFNAGSIETELSFNFSPAAKRTLASYEQALKKAQQKIDSELGAKVDDKGFKDFKTKLDKADKAKAEADLKGDVDESGFRKFKSEVDKADKAKADAELGADVNTKGFRDYEKAADKANRQNTAVDKSSRKAGGGMMAMAGGARMLAGGAAIGGLIIAVKEGLTANSDLNESLSKNKVLFGQNSEEVNKFAKNAANSFGLSQNAALAAAGGFGAFFSAAGKGKKDAAGMSVEFTKLAADLASFNNTSVDDAMQALSSGLAGETEPLRRYQVLLNDASLRQEALKMGLIKTTKEALTPQQKTLATYNLVLSQTKKQQGDFQRTSGGWAGQVKILQAQFANLKNTVGAPLVKAFIGPLQAINKLFAGLSGKGKMNGFVKEIRGFVVGLLPDIKKFGREAGKQFKALIEALKPAAPFLQNILLPLLKGFVKGALAGIIATIKIAVPVIGLLAKALGWIGKVARPLRGVFEKLGMVLGFVLGGPIILKALGLLGKLGKLFGLVGKAVGKTIGFFERFGGSVGKSVGAAGRSIGRFVDRVLGWFKALPGKVGGAVSSIFTKLTSPFRKAWAWIKSSAQGAFDVVKQIWSKSPLGIAFKLGDKIGSKLGLRSEGGPVGPGAGGPQIYMAGEGGRQEWVISQEGDRQQNIGWAVEALDALGVEMFKKGGKPKKKKKAQSNKNLRKEINRIGGAEGAVQNEIEGMQTDAGADGTTSGSEMSVINAKQGQLIGLTQSKLGAINMLIGNLTRQEKQVLTQMRGSKGKRREKLRERLDNIRAELTDLRGQRTDLNYSLNNARKQLNADNMSAEGVMAVETRFDSAIENARNILSLAVSGGDKDLSQENSGLAAALKQRVDELRARLQSEVRPEVKTAIREALDSSFSEYAGLTESASSGLGFTEQVSNLTAARMNLYQQAGNSFGGSTSSRTTNNKNVTVNISGLTKTPDPHLWARRIGSELSMV